MTMVSPAGRSNPRIRLARSLRQRKVREAEGLFLVEGTFHVGTAFAAGADIQDVIYVPELLDSPFAKELIAKMEGKGVACISTSADVFAGLSDKENPQGLLAIIRQSLTTLPSLAPSTSSVYVAIVSPQDPGNVGTIMRSLDAAGADALLLLDGGVDPYHPSAVRAGMGAHFWHPIVQASFPDFAGWAHSHGVHVYGSSAHATKDYGELQPQRPAVLLLGSEREGLSAEQMSICEQAVSIPMRGKVTSLNLAVAAGILLYELGRR